MKIFISYSHQNQEMINTLIDDLKELDHEVWLDKKLPGGSKWWEEILDQIRKCDLFIFALTPEWAESGACRDESQYAHDLHKRILPISFTKNNPVTLLPKYLASTQCVNYQKKDDKEAFSHLNKAFNKLPQPQPLPEPLPDPPEMPISEFVGLKHKFEVEDLNFETQAALLLTLKTHLDKADEFDAVVSLLRQLSKRNDLCPVIVQEINDILVSIEKNTSKDSVEFHRPPLSAASDTKKKVITLFGKSHVGKSAILNSLIGIDIAETFGKDNLLTICFKSPFILVELPGTISNEDHKKLAIKKAQQADGQIFVINEEPHANEIVFFNLVHNNSPDIPKIVFVNKWDLIQNHKPKREQDIIRSRISDKMSKFIKSPKDVVYGSAMLFDLDRDLMTRQEIPQLISRIKEIF